MLVAISTEDGKRVPRTMRWGLLLIYLSGAASLLGGIAILNAHRTWTLSSDAKCNTPADLISAVDQDLREVLPCDAIRICRMTRARSQQQWQFDLQWS